MRWCVIFFHQDEGAFDVSPWEDCGCRPQRVDCGGYCEFCNRCKPFPLCIWHEINISLFRDIPDSESLSFSRIQPAGDQQQPIAHIFLMKQTKTIPTTTNHHPSPPTTPTTHHSPLTTHHSTTTLSPANSLPPQHILPSLPSPPPWSTTPICR